MIAVGVRSPEELGGLLRIGAVASDAASHGIATFIMFTALLSINLGLINMFPIPMLDGGHLVFYAVEALNGKPIPKGPGRPVQVWVFCLDSAHDFRKWE